MINFFFYKKLFYTAALFTGCCFVCSCENDVKVIDDMTKKVVMREEAVNVESMLSQEGKLKAILKAPLMLRVFADPSMRNFQNLFIAIFIMKVPR